MTTPMIDCPALQLRDPKHYPKRYGDRVPATIRAVGSRGSDIAGLTKEPALRVENGEIYGAWTNSYGAVCAVSPEGLKLGLRPSEFDVVTFWVLRGDDWHEEPAEAMPPERPVYMSAPHGMNKTCANATRLMLKECEPVAVFENTKVWSARDLAIRWIRERGLDYGSSCTGCPQGIFRAGEGTCKWRHLKAHEIRALPGLIHTERGGRAVVWLRIPTPKPITPTGD